MNPVARPGVCERCSARLDSLQRYCIGCGERRDDPAPPADAGDALLLLPPPDPATAASRSLPSRWQPSRRSMGAVTVVVLASGLLIGAAVGPAMTPASLASAAKDVVVMTSTPAGTGAAALAASSAAGSDTASSAALEPPSGNVDSPAAADTSAAAGDASASAASAGAGSGTTDTSSSGSGTGTGTTTPDTTTPTPDPAADATAISGTVVHISHDGHAYAVATREGQLIPVHARKPPALGTKVKSTVKSLVNGTFKETVQKTSGTTDKAAFHGTVTFVDADARAYTVSARGVSLLVHAPPLPEPPAAPAPLPALGVQTSIEVAIRPVAGGAPDARELAETTRQDGDPATGTIDIESIVRSVSPDAAQVTLAADDAGESPQTIVMRPGHGVDATTLATGMVLSATARLEADGTWTLVSATDDTDAKVADTTPP